MEDVLAETAISYPETYVQEMTGAQIKDVLEDICDNLFNADPYYQQGGDMVRAGGLGYTCTPGRCGRQPHLRAPSSATASRLQRTVATRSRAGPRSTASRARRCGTSSANICVPAG